MRCLLLVCLLAAISSAHGIDATRRTLHIVNQSGEKVSVAWIHPASGESIPLGAPTNGEELEFDSFINHTFVIRADETSNATVSFQVSGDKRQMVLVKEGLLLEVPSQQPSQEPSVAQANYITRHCHDQAVINKNHLAIEIVLQELTECLTRSTAELLEDLNEKMAQEKTLRLDVSVAAENYTCADPDRQTSDPIEVRTWNYQGEDRTVHVLHDRQSSKIHMLKNFISEEECAAIEQAAKKTLHRGTVADGKGGSRLSDNRKAWQAGIPHNWNVEGDPIAAVSRRLFAYANDVGGYNMDYDGQEDLMSIQYFGNGTDNPAPDRYTPHCDGDCNGLPHKTGGRVATMVMYCDVPELGGGTNFQHSNVFVRPAKGAAAFFSYLDAKTMNMETGFTTHSGCPVYEGIKRIAVQWMRVGVDEENPWDSFDTNTVSRRVFEEEEDDDYEE